MMYKLLDINKFGYFFPIDKYEQMFYYYSCKKEKAYPFKWCWRTYSDRLFHIHTYKFIVQNGLEFETQPIAVT